MWGASTSERRSAFAEYEDIAGLCKVVDLLGRHSLRLTVVKDGVYIEAIGPRYVSTWHERIETGPLLH